MSGAYLTSLRRKVMRVLAGFPAQQGHFLPHAQQRTLPMNCDARYFRRSNTGSTRSNRTKLLGLLDVPRATFLQDSVSVQQRHPHHPPDLPWFYISTIQEVSVYALCITAYWPIPTLLVTVIWSVQSRKMIRLKILLLQRAMPFLEQRLTTMQNEMMTRLSAIQNDLSKKKKNNVPDVASGCPTVNHSINWPSSSESQPPHLYLDRRHQHPSTVTAAKVISVAQQIVLWCTRWVAGSSRWSVGLAGGCAVSQRVRTTKANKVAKRWSQVLQPAVQDHQCDQAMCCRERYKRTNGGSYGSRQTSQPGCESSSIEWESRSFVLAINKVNLSKIKPLLDCQEEHYW